MADCGIYAIINKLNGKTYIGQSIQINVRFGQHIRGNGISHNSAIDLAIKKYGADNFDFKIIEYCDKDKLNDREKYYADLYNTYAPNGYNINVAGESFHNPNSDYEISCYDLLTGEKIQTFYSMHEAERNGFIRTAICCVAEKEKGTAYDMYWCFGHQDKIDVSLFKPKAGKNGGRIVYRYDLKTGDYIDSFESLSKAETFLNKPGGNKNISAVCCKKRKSAYGYYWDYKYMKNYKENNENAKS